MSLSQEQPPTEVEPILREYLSRRFIDIGNELNQPSKFPERKEMPYKPQVGDVHYFGDPATHNYDAVIYIEGFWGMTSTGWVLLDTPNALPWTPVLSDGTNDADTHTVQEGRYSRMGDLVHVDGRLTTSDITSLSGDIRITGLPFTSNAAAPNGTMTAAIGLGLNLTSSESVVGAVALNATHILLGIWKANTGTQAMVAADWSADGDLLFSCFYYV